MTVLFNNRPRAFLAQLEHLSPDEQHDAFANEAIETGGTFGPIGRGVAISLHGLTVIGETETGAMRLWIRIATGRLPQIESDGFVTVRPPFGKPRAPREEIGNALSEFNPVLRRS